MFDIGGTEVEWILRSTEYSVHPYYSAVCRKVFPWSAQPPTDLTCDERKKKKKRKRKER